MSKLELSQIYIYPIKSLRGISLTETRLTARGPQWDRRWMLIDESGRFLSQRELPEMVLLQPYLEEGQLKIIDLRGDREPLFLALDPAVDHPLEPVTIWRDHCEAVRISPEADRWFSGALGTRCRLVYMPDDTRRPVDPAYAREGEVVSFADGYPYLIIGEASLDELNRRLETPIEMLRFRPNFVCSGSTPFAEDHWQQFSIGTARFRGTKPCARCQIPTIDLNTGEASKEPTRTLAGFRREGNKILFGLNACWESASENGSVVINVGDRLKINLG